jgi:hypothetical protein
LVAALRNFFPLPHLARIWADGRGLSGRNDRKVMQVRILPLSRRAITITGDEAHGEHDNTHYHTLPHSGPTAAGYRLLSARSGFDSWHPPPPVTGRSDWVTASKTPQPHQLVREVAFFRGCSSVGRAQRLTTTLPYLGRRLRVTGRKFESCHPHQTGRRSLVIATTRVRATGAVQPEFRDPGAAIAHSGRGFSRSHPLPV